MLSPPPAYARFDPYRIAAFSFTAEFLAARDIPGVTFTGFNQAAERAYRQWINHPSRDRNWPWPSYVADTRIDDPACFEVAIWSEGVLCGLACGAGSDTESYCAVDVIERTPMPLNPLKGRIIEVTTAALFAYAAALGREDCRYVEPGRWLEDRLKRAGLNFTLVCNPGQKHYISL